MKTIEVVLCNGEIYDLQAEGSSHKNFHLACDHRMLILQV